MKITTGNNGFCSVNLQLTKQSLQFITEALDIDMSKVKKIYIDATYGVSKPNTHLYALIAEELSYGVPLGFMLTLLDFNCVKNGQRM